MMLLLFSSFNKVDVVVIFFSSSYMVNVVVVVIIYSSSSSSLIVASVLEGDSDLRVPAGPAPGGIPIPPEAIAKCINSGLGSDNFWTNFEKIGGGSVC